MTFGIIGSRPMQNLICAEHQSEGTKLTLKMESATRLQDQVQSMMERLEKGGMRKIQVYLASYYNACRTYW